MNPRSHHRTLVANGAILLDVRTPDEFTTGHLAGARHIPVDELDRRISELGPPQRPVVVYCGSGRRSQRAATSLRAAGFEVYDLGGMHAW